MYQPREDKRGEFFTDTPQKIFAHLLKYKPSPEELVAWMSDEDEIDRRLKGTELANFAPKDAPQQRSGVLGSLGLVADSLRLLPTFEEAQGRECARRNGPKSVRAGSSSHPRKPSRRRFVRCIRSGLICLCCVF